MFMWFEKAEEVFRRVLNALEPANFVMEAVCPLVNVV